MRETLELSAEPRAKMGKGGSYQTRKGGRIPGVVYGGGTDPQPVSVDQHSFELLYVKGTLLQTLMMLEIGGKKTRVIPRDIQLDPVSDRPIHVDFMRLLPGARISLYIPVRLLGHENSPGLKKGGVINLVRHEVQLYCDVDNIPDQIEASLEGLDIGDSLHISAFTLPNGVTPVIRRDFTVASIAPPTTYTEEAVTTTAAAAAEAAPAAGADAAGAAPAAAGGADKGKAPEKKK